MQRPVRLKFLIFLFASIGVAKAQPLHIWEYTSPPTYQSSFYGACNAANGDYILVGSAPGTDSTDIAVERINADGEHIWTTLLTGAQFTGADTAYSVFESPSGEIHVIAALRQPSFNYYAADIRLTASGSILDVWRYGGQNTGVVAYRGLQTLDGHTLIAGVRRGADNSGDLDGFLLKKELNGDTLWTRRFVLPYGGLRSVIEVPGAGLYAAGLAWSSPNQTNYDFWFVHADSIGRQDTMIDFGTNNHEYCFDLSATANGEVYFGGSVRVGSSIGGRITKSTADGQEIWTRILLESGSFREFKGIAARPSAGCIAVGYVWPGDSLKQMWCVMRETGGGSVGEWMWHESESSSLNAIIPVNSGGWLMVGQRTVDDVPRGYAMLLPAPTGIRGQVVAGHNGEPQRGVSVTTTSGDMTTITNVAGYYILEVNPGTYDIITYGGCVDTDTLRGVIVPEDSSVVQDLVVGVPQYEKQYTSLNLVAPNELESETPIYVHNSGSGDLYFGLSVAGSHPAGSWIWTDPSSGSVSPGDSALVYVHLRPDTSNSGTWEFRSTLSIHTNSCPDTVDVIPVFVTVLDADDPGVLPDEFRLLSAFPNPFNSSTRIKFELPQQTSVTLRIFDIQGRVAAELAAGVLQAGVHDLEFDATGMASGVYLYRLEAGSDFGTGKLLYLR